jgi:hypothetical protein
MAQCPRQYHDSFREEEIVNNIQTIYQMCLMTFLEEVKVSLCVEVTKRVNVLSEYGSGSKDSDNDNTTRVKVDKTPILGQLTGNPGVI